MQPHSEEPSPWTSKAMPSYFLFTSVPPSQGYCGIRKEIRVQDMTGWLISIAPTLSFSLIRVNTGLSFLALPMFFALGHIASWSNPMTAGSAAPAPSISTDSSANIFLFMMSYPFFSFSGSYF